MANHPFHGNWKSYGLNGTPRTFNDGEINLNITAGGTLNHGGHRPRLATGGLGNEVILELLSISDTEIEFRETSSEHCVYHGLLLIDAFQGNRKIIIGTYTLPNGHSLQPLGSEGRRPADVEEVDQINGTWVATQP